MKIKAFGVMLVTALASHLHATEIVTTSFAAWTSTLTGASAEWDFAFPNTSNFGTPSGYSMNVGSYGPVTVIGPDGSGYVLNENPNYFDSTTSQNRLTLETAGDGVGSMVFNTPSAGLTAFAIGLGMLGTAGPVTITLSDGETITAAPSINGDEFIGFSSSTPITSFSLSAPNGSNIELTDFDAGVSSEPAPAAEVTTGIMIGTGLLFLCTRRRILAGLSRSRP